MRNAMTLWASTPSCMVLKASVSQGLNTRAFPGF
jgi:hypothetical protein